jgi:hypothetical protein
VGGKEKKDAAYWWSQKKRFFTLWSNIEKNLDTNERAPMISARDFDLCVGGKETGCSIFAVSKQGLGCLQNGVALSKI